MNRSAFPWIFASALLFSTAAFGQSAGETRPPQPEESRQAPAGDGRDRVQPRREAASPQRDKRRCVNKKSGTAGEARPVQQRPRARQPRQ
jgi:hypothetical protein